MSLLLPLHLAALIARLTADRRVPAGHKMGLAAGLLYLFSPIDLLPEALLGRPALVDDGVVLLRVLRRLLADLDESIVREHWDGDPDDLRTLRRLLVRGDELASAGVRALRNALFPRAVS